MKTKGVVILTVFVTAVSLLAFLAYGGGNILQSLGGSNPVATTTTTTTTVVSGVTEKYTGAVNFQVKGAITANGTSPTAGTAYTVQYLQQIGTGYQPLGSDTDGTEQMVIGKNDKVYARVVIASGQNYYIDVPSTISAQNDGTLGAAFYADPLTSGLASYIFPLDMTVVKSKADPNNVPTYEWYPRFHGYSPVKISAPASQLNIGTGQVTKTILYQLTFDTQPAGNAAKAIQVRVNGTESTNEVAEEQSYVDIPNAAFPNSVQRVYLSDMTQAVDYTTVAFNATLSQTNEEDRVVGKTIFRHVYTQSTVNGANIITVPTTGSNVVNIPVTITGTTSGAICVQLKVEPISARNAAITAVYDSAELVSGASNTNECTMGGST